MKRLTSRALAVILLLVLLSTQCLGEAGVRSFSLSDCLNAGLANNLDIKIAKIEVMIKDQDVLFSESIFDTILSGKLAYTDDRREVSSTLVGTESLTTGYQLGLEKTLSTGTEIDINYSNTRKWTNSGFVVNNPIYTGEISFTVKQPVLKNFFGYVDRKTVALSKIETEIAGLKSLDRIENAFADIEKAYWSLVFTYEKVALSKGLLKQAKRLYDIYNKHLQTGFAEQGQVYETEANMRIRKTELAIAENELENASNHLKLLINNEGKFLIMPKERLETLDKGADLIESLNEAFIAKRDYREKKKELAGKKIKLKMKKNSLWPEVDLVGTFAVNGVDRKSEKVNGRLTTDKFPYYYAGVELTMPLENKEARSEYNRAALEKEKVILELLQTEKDIINQIDEKVRSVNLNLENAKRWTNIKNIQYLKFLEEEKKMQHGRSSSKTLIDYQNDFIRAALSKYKSVLDYYHSLIDLENAKDKLLEKIGVVEE